MRALVVTGPGEAEVQDVVAPTPAAGELLVDVERAGICGTDVELYHGSMAYLRSGLTHYPVRPGHEWTGRVVGAGSSDDEAWIGRRITGDTMLGCGTCPACRRGVHHVCPNRFEIGITDGWPGALAEQMLVPTRFAYAIPEHVTVAAAALVEPGGNALRAVQAARLDAGDPVLILGSGTIGLLAAQFALADGAEVSLAGNHPGSFDLARRLGVPDIMTIDEAAESDGNRFRAVIDCTSDADSPALAVRLVRPAGRVVLIGLSSTPSAIDTRDLVLRDVTAVGILSASPGLAQTIDAYATGGVVPDRIVSEVIGLEEVPSRLEGIRSPDSGPGPKVHVDPRR